MRKTILSFSVAAVAAVPIFASAQQAAPAAPQSPHTFTGNMTLVSDYRFRGISQTFGMPALQGGFDYSHASGIYLGNWNSNVSETAGYPNGNIEMDFYGGFKKSWGDWGLDLGFIYYYYPGSNAAGNGNYKVANPLDTAGHTGAGFVKNEEIYIGASWKWLSAKYYRSVSDYFSVPNTTGSNYIDLSASYDIGSGWGVNAHLGRLHVENFPGASYNDYKLGVTKDVSGWVYGASLIGTTAAMDGSCATAGTSMTYHFCKLDTAGAPSKDLKAGKNTVVFSLGKSF